MVQKVGTLKWILTGIVNPDDDFDSTKRSSRSRATGICIFYIFSCIFRGFAMFFGVFSCFLMFLDGFRWFWKGLGGFGRVWEGLGGFGRVWEGWGGVGRGGEGWGGLCVTLQLRLGWYKKLIL